jgi:DNA-directed RNA polymerase specialized sigma24 family protein
VQARAETRRKVLAFPGARRKTVHPALSADVMVREAFSPSFGERLPPHLGSEAFKTIRLLLSAGGFPYVEQTEEVFVRSLTNGLDYLHRHGGKGIQNPRPWFHRVCHNEAARFLSDADAHAVLSLMEGNTDTFDVTIHEQRRVDELIRGALAQLPPRYRELMQLDIIENLSASEIEKRMGIQSHRHFLKLKREALAALRDAVKTLLEKKGSSLL